MLATGLAAAGAMVLALTAGGSGGADGPAVRAVADEAPGYAVEDFNYPGADRILAEQGITLKRGDGHILLADCVSDTGQLEVWARSREKVCFNVTGNSGWLTLEIPSVYAVRGNDYQTEVAMTVDDERKTFEVGQNTWTPVGESADPDGREHMLVEIRATK
ncbi:hypothetical protein SSP24_66410 [Streptomyces spinoverrucosus]|uniref:Secreted protein n=1 Tax=Streptomyces spinoverrucosus TaxID=284043 RepID=A0A4Y3VVL2_9ACTN|nr:hypothetical protein SSP24_66410 [Streptomyces spinoverrucosus]GHB66075.1 hypothetical protein GCM10010397_40180 [Streptomyces spinoverrucosus]